jgi:predicted component of type VI protein secretion system
MALRLIQEPTPLHEAQNSSAVLRYLLDWNTTGREQISALTRAFADLALHQVAMLSGVIEGARSLMNTLSPTTISGAQSAAIARSGGSGLFQRLFPFRRASLWQSFTDRHTQLMEEDRFTREVFGGHFARAYFTVTGGHMEQGHAAHSPSGQQQAQAMPPQQQYGAYATRPPQ